MHDAYNPDMLLQNLRDAQTQGRLHSDPCDELALGELLMNLREGQVHDRKYQTFA